MTRLDRGATGTCALGIAHEGPPGYGHGGIGTMLLTGGSTAGEHQRTYPDQHDYRLGA
ncbi:hypothetical protein [Streptomyces sp. NPDC058751]|uniref:hypothetical protein n=1 Tax=Streptomyces sp. NPDC058751 TaxID=3346623 RepID=UPI0036BE522C